MANFKAYFMAHLSRGCGKGLLAAALTITLGNALEAQTSPSTCNYTLSYTSLSISPAGGNRSVDVNTGVGCGWSAVIDVSWITILAGASGTGSGTVGFAVNATNLTTSRTGHIMIGGQTLAVTEIALLGPQAHIDQIWMARTQVANTVNTPACSTAPGVVTTFLPTDPAAYVFVNVSAVTVGDVISTQYVQPNGTVYANAGSSYTVTGLDVQSVCVEDQGLKIVGAAPAGIPGLWTANVKVNGVLVITTTFTILGQSTCSYILTPASLSVPPGPGNGYSIGVFTSAGCAWTVVNTSQWVTITANSSGTGPGTVLFSAAANGGDSRTANLTIGGQAVAITQVSTAGPQAQVQQIWMTRSPFSNSNAACSDASAPATTFDPTDAAAYLFLSATRVSGGDIISDQYFAPDGSLYPGAGGTVGVKSTVPFACWEDPGLAIRGTPVANMTGTWLVKVQVNGVLVITTSFSILAPANCLYTLNSNSANFAFAGGLGSVAVATDPGCSWSASTSAPWIHVTSGSSGTGGGTVGYTVDLNSGDVRTATLVVGGQVLTLSQASGLPSLPSISQGGVAEPWTYTKGVSPGAWISIFGTNLANATQTWSPSPGQPLATTLSGVSVTVDGIPAAPAYVSPTLVNVLAPAGIRSGTVQIVVSSNGLSSQPYTIQSTKFLPAIYSNAAPGTAPPRFYVTAVDPLTNQLLGNPSADPRVVRAPRAGDTIDLYALGLGPATPQFPTDRSFTGAFSLTASVSVVLGGVSLNPSFAALVAPGLYQMRITIPAGVATGDQPILLDLGAGVQGASNVFLSIQR